MAEKCIPQKATLVVFRQRWKKNFDEINFLVECAKKYGFLISGGSDYHGTNKSIPLLKLNCDNISIDSKQLTILKAI